MRALSLFLIVFAYFSVVSCLAGSEDGQLNGVVVIYRHGDRTPIRPYPNDPYGNRSYWPEDYGMLTNIGKKNHFELGQWFRQRYSDFLPAIYSEKDIYVQSTDVDRTLMSALANLAGLYPPIGTDVWKSDLPWQPIPIHTIPEHLDAVLAAKKPCPKHERLTDELYDTEYFKNVTHRLHDLYAYVTKYTGQSVHNLKGLEYLYSTLFIENKYNLTLPEWARKVFPDKLKPWASLSFAVPTWTPDMARLKTGPFFNELLEYFANRTQKDAKYYAPKLLMYSAHDTVVANLLNSMGAFEPHPPPYTATIIFELRRKPNGTDFVRTFYKNTSDPRPVSVLGCESDCDLAEFERRMKPIALNLKQWEVECQNGWSVAFYLTLVGVVLAILCVTGIVCVAGFRLKRRNEFYTQLPDEEYA